MPKLRALKEFRASLGYQTRMLRAGDEFEISDNRMARVLTNPKVGRAEYITEAPRRRLKVSEPEVPQPEPEPDPEPEPSVKADEYHENPEPEPEVNLEDMTRADLLALARFRDLELPSGYVTKEELIALLS